VHGVAAFGFELPLGGKNFFSRAARFLLPRLNLDVKFVRFAGRGF
jgi:hypothetical protein